MASVSSDKHKTGSQSLGSTVSAGKGAGPWEEQGVAKLGRNIKSHLIKQDPGAIFNTGAAKHSSNALHILKVQKKAFGMFLVCEETETHHLLNILSYTHQNITEHSLYVCNDHVS